MIFDFQRWGWGARSRDTLGSTLGRNLVLPALACDALDQFCSVQPAASPPLVPMVRKNFFLRNRDVALRPSVPPLNPPRPSGPLWLHEIKHDGFRVIACKDGAQVRLYNVQATT